MLINLGIALLVAFVPFVHRFSEIAGGLLIVVTEYTALTGIAPYIGRDGGTPLLLIIGAAVPFFIFGLGRLKLAIAVVLGGLALHLFIWFSYPPSVAIIPPNPRVLNDLYTQAAITTFSFIAVTVWYAFRLVENAKTETDQLLRNILPDKIAERLKKEPETLIADNFESASILFSDISGFVPRASIVQLVLPAHVASLLLHVSASLKPRAGPRHLDPDQMTGFSTTSARLLAGISTAAIRSRPSPRIQSLTSRSSL